MIFQAVSRLINPHVYRYPNPKRDIIVHYHIYKNAGTSIDHQLEKIYGRRWLEFEGNSDKFALTASQLANFFKENLDAIAISSHKVRPPTPGSHIHPIVLLRHPIDRARSIYHFGRRDPAQHDHAVASTNDFRGYIEWSLDTPGVGVVLRDYQVIHLSSASFRYKNIQDAEATAEDLSEAIGFLNSLSAFGIVREFDASCGLFNHAYRPFFPDLNLQPVRENSSTETALTEEEVLEKARSELGNSLYQRLMAANSQDLALYNYARKRFRDLLAHAGLV
ncbi:hypothetical protein [Nitrospirillum sp. BR 11828]|uniref:hypothetical protein n=1 Tax=Nitrospirillum sp. BR 11828 TaxID=3104325 RepID=UPI002ACAA073|nr:hypothetical protein [Nitrospirillum sp. BR 11828]MDZ5650597.1 hypothetical protein [Nitrospirillum sp. BR 11828]